MSTRRLQYWSARMAAGVVLTFCLVAEPAYALPFFVNASSAISGAACCAPNLGDQLISLYSDVADTGALPQTSTSTHLFHLETFNGNIADASSLGTAALGALRATAAVNTGTASALGITAAIAATAGNLATATTDVGWGDTITIGGEGAVGTPVDFLATLRLTVAALSSTFSSGNFFSGDPGSDAEVVSTIDIRPPGGGVLTLRAGDCAHLSVPDCLSPGDGHISESLALHLRVGDSLSVFGDLFLDISAFNGANAFVDAGDTATFNLDPLTPGGTYTTASGVTYFTPAAAAPVPQPATLSLLGAALILALTRSARQRRGKFRT